MKVQHHNNRGGKKSENEKFTTEKKESKIEKKRGKFFGYKNQKQAWMEISGSDQ